MKTFITRTLSGAVFAVIMIAGVSFHAAIFLLLHVIIGIFCIDEFKIMFEKKYEFPKRRFSLLMSRVLIVTILTSIGVGSFLDSPMQVVSIAILALFLLIVIQLFSNSVNATLDLSYNVFGLIFVSVAIGCLFMIAAGNGYLPDNLDPWFANHGSIILGIMLLIWTNDSLAYITGSLIGKHKLFPSISPGKTWEGFAGGVVFTIVVAFFLAKWLTIQSATNWMIIAGIVSVFGTLGDLVESMMKRNAGVKDSGNIMPGHGGFLDRFDAYLFVMPFIYAFLQLQKTFPQ